MSIATAITDLQGRIEDAYDALELKGATIPATKNTYNLPTTIGTISTGGGSAEKKDVNFIDYDGSILHSYTAQEAQALTELPALPTHTGLTCQGWNYTLAQMKSCVSDVGTCCVGAMYVTDDGKTRLKITIDNDAYATIPLAFSQTASGGVEINWGDESQVVTVSGTGDVTTSHTYTPNVYPATYVITLNVTNGTMSFPTNIMGKTGSQDATNPINAWCSMLVDEVNIGDKVVELGERAFQQTNIKTITIPNTVTSIGNYAFSNCYQLSSITIPNTVTGISERAFSVCYGITSISIPSSVTSIGTNAFYYDYSLSSITIPNTVTSIGSYAFAYCYNLASTSIPNTVTSIGTYAFQSCYGQETVTLGTGITSITDYMFQLNQSLSSITIPNTVTSIGSYAFGNCQSLTTISIPSSVTSIGTYAFFNCYGLRLMDFSSATSVPTLSNTNALNGTSNDMKILVPTNLYDTWKAATNWSTYANRIVAVNTGLAFTATQSNSTICLNKVGNPNDVKLEYKTSSGNWTPYVIGTTLTISNANDAIYMRGKTTTNQNFGLDENNYYQFSMSGGISASGNIQYLRTIYNTTNSALSEKNAYCFYKLFSGCAALVNAPDVETGGDYKATGAYAYTFEGCTGLTALPSNFQALFTNIRSQNLYKGMFKGCTGLTSVELPFINLSTVQQYPATGCFDEMFMNCSSLNEIQLMYTGNFDTDHFNDWVKNVAATGTFYYNGNDTTVGDYAIPTGWTLKPYVFDGLTVEAREANSTVSMVNDNSAPTLSLQYSTDGGSNWNTFTVGTTTVTLANVGDKVCFRGTNTKLGGSSNTSRNRFSFTGQVALSGNINSLLDQYSYNTLLDLSSGRDRVFQGLFYNNTYLVDASELILPATSIGNNAYYQMFEGCTGLVNPPTELPNTTFGGSSGYDRMFYGCSSLTKSPYIKATSLNSSTCQYMFNGCTSLQEIKLDYIGEINFTNWVAGVSSSGVLYYNGATQARSNNTIPDTYGWIVCPFDQPISFINTNNAQVDLGYTPSLNARYVGKIRGVGDFLVAKGGRGTETVYLRSGSGLDYTFDMNTISSGNNTWDASKWYDVEVGNFYFNAVPDSGTTVTASGTTDVGWYSRPSGLYLGRTSYGRGVCLAGLKIYESGTLVKEYEPAVDGNDVACLHETIGDTYIYPTSGTLLAFMVDNGQ